MKKVTEAWKQMTRRVAIPCGDCIRTCRCSLRLTSPSSSGETNHRIPRDVPKGHIVVYVGKEDDKYKRFVIKITLLQDPIFRALLDQSRDEVYGDFTAGDPKLRIPCDESLFLEVLRCAAGNSRSYR